VPEDVVAARVEELMLVQQDFVFNNNRALAEYGWEIDVLIDAPTASRGRATTGVGKGGKLYEGRGYHQAPGIDGLTYVQSRQPLSPGELIRCKVVDADGYDLIATPLTDLQRKVSLPLA